MKNNPMQSRIPGIGVIAIFDQPPLAERFVRRNRALFSDALPEPNRVAAAQFALEIGGALVRYPLARGRSYVRSSSFASGGSDARSVRI
jgi:hypothetical protein